MYLWDKGGGGMKRLVIFVVAMASAMLAACGSGSGSGPPDVRTTPRDRGAPTVSLDRSEGGVAAPLLTTYFKTFTSDQGGQIELTPILDIRAFRAVNVEVTASYPNQIRVLRVEVNMGKISGDTLAQTIDRFPAAFPGHPGPVRIHTYRVMGPDLAVWVLGAPPNIDVAIQAWVFMH
jgi:predicted small secreted protein